MKMATTHVIVKISKISRDIDPRKLKKIFDKFGDVWEVEVYRSRHDSYKATLCMDSLSHAKDAKDEIYEWGDEKFSKYGGHKWVVAIEEVHDKKRSRKHIDKSSSEPEWRDRSSRKHPKHSKSRKRDTQKRRNESSDDEDGVPTYELFSSISSNDKPFEWAKVNKVKEIIEQPRSNQQELRNFMDRRELWLHLPENDISQEEVYEKLFAFGDIDTMKCVIIPVSTKDQKKIIEQKFINVRFYLLHSAKTLMYNADKFSIRGKKVPMMLNEPTQGSTDIMYDKPIYSLTRFNWSTLKFVFAHKTPAISKTEQLLNKYGKIKAITQFQIKHQGKKVVVQMVDFEKDQIDKERDTYYCSHIALEALTAEEKTDEINSYLKKYPCKFDLAVEGRNLVTIRHITKMRKIKVPKMKKEGDSAVRNQYDYFNNPYYMPSMMHYMPYAQPTRYTNVQVDFRKQSSSNKVKGEAEDSDYDKFTSCSKVYDQIEANDRETTNTGEEH